MKDDIQKQMLKVNKEILKSLETQRTEDQKIRRQQDSINSKHAFEEKVRQDNINEMREHDKKIKLNKAHEEKLLSLANECLSKGMILYNSNLLKTIESNIVNHLEPLELIIKEIEFRDTTQANHNKNLLNLAVELTEKYILNDKIFESSKKFELDPNNVICTGSYAETFYNKIKFADEYLRNSKNKSISISLDGISPNKITATFLIKLLENEKLNKYEREKPGSISCLGLLIIFFGWPAFFFGKIPSIVYLVSAFISWYIPKSITKKVDFEFSLFTTLKSDIQDFQKSIFQELNLKEMGEPDKNALKLKQFLVGHVALKEIKEKYSDDIKLFEKNMKSIDENINCKKNITINIINEIAWAELLWSSLRIELLHLGEKINNGLKLKSDIENGRECSLHNTQIRQIKYINECPICAGNVPGDIFTSHLSKLCYSLNDGCIDEVDRFKNCIGNDRELLDMYIDEYLQKKWRPH